MYLDILFPLTKAIQIIFELVITYYQTPKTCISHKATRYHKFNALTLELPYIFSQFNMDRR